LPARVWTRLRRVIWCALSAVLGLDPRTELVSTGTVVTLVVGIAIAYVYLRYMWSALQRAVRTRDDPDLGEDRYRFSLVGAVVAVVGSITAIAVYGAGPALLNLGPLLVLGSSVAVAYCLRQEAAGD
jgi:hypothetical protein